MIRTSRTPTFILIALLVVILILTYNYWSLSDKNQSLKSSLLKADEKKSLVERENHINAGRVKYFEDRADALQKTIKDREDEVASLKSQLKAKTEENDRSLWEVSNMKTKLETCYDEAKEKISTLTSRHEEEMELIRTNNTNLNEQINKLLATIAQDKVKLTLDQETRKQMCINESNSAVDSFKSKVIGLVNSKLDEQTAAKVQQLIKTPIEVTDRIIVKPENSQAVETPTNAQAQKAPDAAKNANSQEAQKNASNDANKQVEPPRNENENVKKEWKQENQAPAPGDSKAKDGA